MTKPDGKKPAKHKYVKGYRRGLELYGQQAARLDEPHVAESLRKNGLAICEGANDCIHVVGKTAVGRTTVEVLSINSDDQLALRSS